MLQKLHAFGALGWDTELAHTSSPTSPSLEVRLDILKKCGIMCERGHQGKLCHGPSEGEH